jgi:hypothetical protein
VGLQVVALGGGRFRAVQYAGGLPGSGWDGSGPLRMHGQRQDRVVTLETDSQRVIIADRRARFLTPSGQVLGVLQKVRRRSRTLGARPPAGAVVLYDGTSTRQLRNARTTDDGLLQMGTELKRVFGDYTLHLEFRLPYMPYARGQGRANSGVYLQSRYEMQILDSFGLSGAQNECGALYEYRKPDFNMCLPPLAWQTYEIAFRSPRFDAAGKKICHASITVWHNGIPIHQDVPVQRKTGAGRQRTTATRCTFATSGWWNIKSPAAWCGSAGLLTTGPSRPGPRHARSRD